MHTFLERVFYDFPQHSQYPILLIFASFREAFWALVSYFLGTPATSDIYTPFNEKQVFVKVPGLLFSHILNTFKQLPFWSSLFHFLSRFWDPWGTHGGAYGPSFRHSFFGSFFGTLQGEPPPSEG